MMPSQPPPASSIAAPQFNGVGSGTTNGITRPPQQSPAAAPILAPQPSSILKPPQSRPPLFGSVGPLPPRPLQPPPSLAGQLPSHAFMNGAPPGPPPFAPPVRPTGGIFQPAPHNIRPNALPTSSSIPGISPPTMAKPLAVIPPNTAFSSAPTMHPVCTSSSMVSSISSVPNNANPTVPSTYFNSTSVGRPPLSTSSVIRPNPTAPVSTNSIANQAAFPIPPSSNGPVNTYQRPIVNTSSTSRFPSNASPGPPLRPPGLQPLAPPHSFAPSFHSQQPPASRLQQFPPSAPSFAAPASLAGPPLATRPLAPPPLAHPPLAPPPLAQPVLAPPPLAQPALTSPPFATTSSIAHPPGPPSSTQPSVQPPPPFKQPSAFQNSAPRSYPVPASSQPPAPRSAQVYPQPQQQQQQYGPGSSQYQSSVIGAGWNKGWGTDHVDLLQHRQVVSPEAIQPPKVILQQDFLRNCSPDILRCTFTKIPETKSLLQKAKMPFGILIHPFKDLEQLPVVSCQQIVRCRACRTYINPFVVFRGDRRWECNLCFRINDLPDEFQYDPVSQTYGDPSRRPEVREATLEYIAPSEYMLRPPQPAVYLWLLDTSRQAVDTGYLKVVCDVLRDNLDQIPGDKRALIGIMTFSATVQFYLMPEGCKSVQLLEVGDLDDIFVPHPDDLLINIHEQREQLEKLLTSLPQTHANTPHTQSALGPALTAAFKLVSPLGGRLTVMTAIMPNIGPGALKPREDPNQRAAADVLHLNPATDFYKKLALDCSGQQVAVDLFILNSEYIDLSTLSGVSKFSAGCIHHFPNFHVHLNPPSVAPLIACLTRYITRKIGFEAVMRIRATRGLAITNFHGHFFVRSPDLLSLPNINPDAGYAMQVAIEENLHNIRTAAFQAALLYTSSRGERRIRVHTLCLPVTGNLHDVISGVDQQAAIGLLARMAVDRCHGSTSTDARDALVNACVDALTSYRNSLTQSPGRALVASHNIKLWPLYTLALLKSISLRTGLSTKLDDRVFAMCELKTMPTKALIASVYPDLFPVHALSETGALNIQEEVVPQPPRLQLSAEYLSQDGAYLADTGTRMLLYIRSGVCSDWLQQVMDVPHFGALPHLCHTLPDLDTAPSRLLNALVRYLNSNRPYQSPIVIMREDSPARLQFTQLLIEDRTDGSKSYVEFLQYLAAQVK